MYLYRYSTQKTLDLMRKGWRSYQFNSLKDFRAQKWTFMLAVLSTK